MPVRAFQYPDTEEAKAVAGILDRAEEMQGGVVILWMDNDEKLHVTHGAMSKEMLVGRLRLAKRGIEDDNTDEFTLEGVPL